MSLFTMIRSYLQLKINEKKPREDILKYQQRKFRKILKFSYNNSAFYHKLYSSKGIMGKDLDSINIEDLPVIDKKIVMENFDEILTTNDFTKKDVLNFLEKSKDPNNLFKNKYHIVHTSGSSGKIGVFVYGKKDWDFYYPYIVRILNFSFKKNRSSFFGAADGHFIGVSFNTWLSKSITQLLTDSLILDITKPLDEAVSKLNDFQPSILGGYFTGLKILAQEQEKGNLKVKPKIIVNCGEGINVKDKEYIEKIFDAPMRNLYGLAECPVMGVGKKEYDGIYMMDDLVYLEIKKDHVLFTNLFNKTQPLIRYRIDDFFEIKSDENKLLPFTLVDNVVGRSESMLWLENNDGKMDFIHPIVIAEFYVKGLDKLQIAVKNKKSFEFRAVINSKDKKKVKESIAKKLDEILLTKNFKNVKYEIKEFDNIDIDEKTGKYKLIVNEYR